MARPLKRLRYAPIRYQIAIYGGALDVKGYAVDLPAPLDWLHICVRRDTWNDWRIDHYETGVAIVGPVWRVTSELTAAQRRLQRRYRFDHSSRDAIVRSAWAWCNYLHGLGALRPRIERAIAGDLGRTSDDRRLLHHGVSR